MQKFTIFTIIFSTLVITIIGELVVQDYLQKVYNPSSLQANALGAGDIQDYVAPFDAASDQTEEQSSVAELTARLQELANNTNPDSTKEDSSQETDADSVRPNSREELINANSEQPFERIESLLPALQIEGLALSKDSYNQRLFQLIDTSSLDFVSTEYAVLNQNDQAVGSAYEFELRTAVDAENAFDEIRILANSFPSIDTNQTNQFGERSYYINHLVKVGEVFLVIQDQNKIFAFAYKKEFHEKFKTFFGVVF